MHGAATLDAHRGAAPSAPCWWRLGEKLKAEAITRWDVLTVSNPNTLLNPPSPCANGVAPGRSSPATVTASPDPDAGQP